MQAQNTTFIPDFKTLARTISLVENEAEGFDRILESLQPADIPVVGFTGPPGAGKSTLLNAVVGLLLDEGKKIGLILIDPSSPFNLGALLGDRLRMSAHFNNPNLFIRSLASRGSLGGLSDKIIEITEVMKAYPFDYIFIETVGVGQSEVEIAGLADTTVVILVPEGGDSVQAMKAGLMEIADIFVINKADRPEAEAILNFLAMQLHINGREHIPILKTIAVEGKGVKELIEAFTSLKNSAGNDERKITLMADKAIRIIQRNRMKGFDKKALLDSLKSAYQDKDFNLYRFTRKYLHSGSL
jgi:LAO/AO transport system kinase